MLDKVVGLNEYIGYTDKVNPDPNPRILRDQALYEPK